MRTLGAEMKVLARGWHRALEELAANAQRELVVCSPFVGCDATELLMGCLTPDFRNAGSITFITDLSPSNICQRSTDPRALRKLRDHSATFSIMAHLAAMCRQMNSTPIATLLTSSGASSTNSSDLSGGRFADDSSSPFAMRRTVCCGCDFQVDQSTLCSHARSSTFFARMVHCLQRVCIGSSKRFTPTFATTPWIV